jgi:hypothetical protein
VNPQRLKTATTHLQNQNQSLKRPELQLKTSAVPVKSSTDQRELIASWCKWERIEDRYQW